LLVGFVGLRVGLRVAGLRVGKVGCLVGRVGFAVVGADVGCGVGCDAVNTAACVGLEEEKVVGLGVKEDWPVHDTLRVNVPANADPA